MVHWTHTGTWKSYLKAKKSSMKDSFERLDKKLKIMQWPFYHFYWRHTDAIRAY